MRKRLIDHLCGRYQNDNVVKAVRSEILQFPLEFPVRHGSRVEKFKSDIPFFGLFCEFGAEMFNPFRIHVADEYF